MAGIRTYTLQDVLKNLNDQSLQTVPDDPTEVINILAAVAETVRAADATSASLFAGTYVWGPPGTGQTSLVWQLGQWG